MLLTQPCFLDLFCCPCFAFFILSFSFLQENIAYTSASLSVPFSFHLLSLSFSPHSSSPPPLHLLLLLSLPRLHAVCGLDFSSQMHLSVSLSASRDRHPLKPEHLCSLGNTQVLRTEELLHWREYKAAKNNNPSIFSLGHHGKKTLASN